MAIARSTFYNKKILDNIISRIEKLRMHMKRNLERELVINKDGTLSHDECVNHTLLENAINIIFVPIVMNFLNFSIFYFF
ncbi:hypothetical protein Glove_374g52 [Diversispora epigaea]|uniref:Uncharacterized protein n=1 Tax=Diversispora epigaea TaxID=1348612 RepID=A0A397HDA2_9GLOM|nr:hypothetical protein Glove_374g52 [Diversispora epigaea]